MGDIKLAVWNCSGALPSTSTQNKINFLRSVNFNWDIVILVETHHKELSDLRSLQTFTNKYEILQTGARTDDPYAGIIVLIDKRLTVKSTQVLLPGRLFHFKISGPRSDYNITAVYGHTGSSATLSNIKNFIDIITPYHRRTENNIIIGDFNFVENDLDRVSSSRLGMNATDKTLSRPWIDYSNVLDILDPFRMKNPRKRMFSYIHTSHKAKSRIDRVYVSENFSNNIILYKHIHTPFVKAHRIVNFVISEGIERGPGFWKMNVSILSDRAYEMTIEKTKMDVMNLRIHDPIERWLVLVATIRLETQIYCTRKYFQENKIKKMCEERMEALENNPLLAQDIHLSLEYEYYSAKLDVWTRKHIQGIQTRIKTHPKFEFGEPNIAFYADLEKKAANKRNLMELQDIHGQLKHTTEDIIEVATTFYTDLFSTKNTDEKATQQLLRNVHKKLSHEDMTALDRMITLEELEKAVFKLQLGKAPGPDGIPAEFYQYFWDEIKALYLDFINAVQLSCFPKHKNTSITTLVYKERGETFLLTYYRPIALMNVDVKILTKLLSMRLVKILPSIIHESQVAVYGRRIDNNVNMVRDLIDLANKNEEEAALLFLDQEKAFDRVNHHVLLKVLKQFGFGPNFVAWINTLYSNAFTRISINGFLTQEIPLRSGVRQGCPLSPLLYVLIIELLALQLRANPNIVGFTIGGEKLISLHYSDDAVIKIIQNQCFKEVYKDLLLYEKGIGAKINYEKTQGLWLGKWRHRTDDPFKDLYSDPSKRIKWSSGNVKYLGIYVGNQNPALQTFEEIVPKVIRRLNFWKQLALPVLSKSRVVEIFLASKLWYAASFYPIPAHLEKQINEAFLDYITFPKNKKDEVSRMEMEKERSFGGIKLINTQLKSVTPKIHWLIRLTTDDNLRVHRIVFGNLIGEQRGGLQGDDLLFTEHSYVRSHLKCSSPFYVEALLAITKLNLWKNFPNINDEHLYYNKIFSTTVDDEIEEKTVKPFLGNKVLANIRTYGDLLAAEHAVSQPRLTAVIRKKIESIAYIRPSASHNEVVAMDFSKMKFTKITQKFIYSQLIQQQSRDHIYQTKWATDHGELSIIEWPKVWDSVHQQFFTEAVKSTIWSQVHLNFYTTYSYNKWHNSLNPCPLCGKIPDDIYHILLDCQVTNHLWNKLHNTLVGIVNIEPSLHERVFGLQPRNKRQTAAVVLRNWLTFSLRHQIMEEERKAFYLPKYTNLRLQAFMKKYNFLLQQESTTKWYHYISRNLESKFDKIFTVNNIVGSKIQGEYFWNNLL